MLIFFFNQTATTQIYTLSLHDALPIPPGKHLRERCETRGIIHRQSHGVGPGGARRGGLLSPAVEQLLETHLQTTPRSEEHTSELQSQSNIVCRLLLENKKSTVHTTVHQ